ncbi:MAG: lipid-A-disaccharide synthase-related protein [Candidatus Sericytochromatia bacterium]
MPPRRPLLMLSNGHGEDAIAAALIPHLRAEGATVEALPIVGEGHAYRALDVPMIGPTQAMPSGGFVYGRPVALAGDLAGGLIQLTRRQIAAVRETRGRYAGVVAVGDIVVLGFARLAKAPIAIVGCAKSDHYLHGKPGSYLWHERLLMRHPRCAGVYPRDRVTTDNLRAIGIDATYLGNPMMDGLAPTGRPLPDPSAATTILILPGSRQEAHANVAPLRAAARAMRMSVPASSGPVRFLAAIAPGLALAPFEGDGFTLGVNATLTHPDGTTIHLLEGAFADAAHAADLALAMAGTATEQVVGLGKPVVAVPGRGPQFTHAFAEAQTRLLGESVTLVTGGPDRIAEAAWAILADPDRLHRIAENGRQRMGESGASSRLARHIMSHAW